MAIVTKAVTLGPTNASGDFSIDVEAHGLIRAVGVVIGTLANTVDLTITDALTTAAVVAKTNIAASVRFQPKVLQQGATGADLAANAGPPAIDNVYDSPAVFRNAHIVIAQGGDTKTGTLYLEIER
jgi:hypothetical protein